MKIWGRTAGPVTSLQAIVEGTPRIELDWGAAGTNHPPAATSYQIGTKIALTIAALNPRYYYATAALDNVTGRPGPRSSTVTATTA